MYVLCTYFVFVFVFVFLINSLILKIIVLPYFYSLELALVMIHILDSSKIKTWQIGINTPRSWDIIDLSWIDSSFLYSSARDTPRDILWPNKNFMYAIEKFKYGFKF